MSMLKSFFEMGTDPHLFDGLAITKETELCEVYMGKFPVVFISLKNIDGLTYQEAERGLTTIIIREARHMSFLQESTALSENERKEFFLMMGGDFSKFGLEAALTTLTNFLHKHYSQKVIVLIEVHHE